MKTAIIVGATGLVGSFLIDQLLSSKQIGTVHSFSRRSLNKPDTKLIEHIGDLLDPNYWKLSLRADLLFICIGTTKAHTPSEKLYRSIDFGIPLSAVQWGQKHGVSRSLVISSMGANPTSGNFYLRTKGQMEEALKQATKDLVILQPSMILGPRKESRALERLASGLIKVLKPFVPRKYQGVEAEDIAKAMFRLSLAHKAPELIPSDQIKVLAQA
jgi:uncharacterized protein YbjT (DUF2867 family)